MRYIYLFIVAVIVVIYISYYYKYPKHVTILQTALPRFYFDMLREKQPIVIEEKVVDVVGLCNMWFKQNMKYPFSVTSYTDDTTVWTRNDYKYMVLHCEEPCEVLLASARDKLDKNNELPEHATIVAIHLSAKQSVIVPFHMYYTVIHNEKQINVTAVGVHDLITCILP
jgi:hypothetical protein